MLHFQECKTASGWQTVMVESSVKGQPPYEVLLPPWDRSDTAEAVCTCEGFRFRGSCRHTREAMSQVCNWSGLDSEAQTPDQAKHRVCPECGGKTSLVMLTDKEA